MKFALLMGRDWSYINGLGYLLRVWFSIVGLLVIVSSISVEPGNKYSSEVGGHLYSLDMIPTLFFQFMVFYSSN